MIKILSATNRQGSLTEKISKYYKKTLEIKNITTEIITLKDLPDDAINSILYQNNGKNKQFNVLRDKIKESQKLIFIIPEYNGSFPGVLKLFIDGLGYPSELETKKCALVGVSDGMQGCLLGLSHISDILHYLGAYIYPFKVRLYGIKNAKIEDLISNKSFVKTIENQLNKFIAF